MTFDPTTEVDGVFVVNGTNPHRIVISFEYSLKPNEFLD